MTSSDNNEILFWKVFHNKYIFRLIFNQIHSTEWIQYDNYKEITNKNRFKFKDLFQMKWFLEKGQYELFKDKINHDEHIFIDDESNILLFTLINKSMKNVSNETIAASTTPTKTTTKLEKEISNLESLKEIFFLLLTKKRIEFEIWDLVKLALEADCLYAMEILTNGEYGKFVVYPSTLEQAITYSDPSMVLQILKTQSLTSLLITDYIKRNSIRFASKNHQHRNEMLSLVLNNPSLYTLPTEQQYFEKDISFGIKHSLNSSGKSNKRIKPLDVLYDAVNSNNQDEDDEDDKDYESDEDEDDEESTDEEEMNQTISSQEDQESSFELKHKNEIISAEVSYYGFLDISVFQDVNSIDTIDRLIDLNLFKKFPSKSQVSNFKFEHTFKQLATILKIYFKFYDHLNVLLNPTIKNQIQELLNKNQQQEEPGSLKELQRLIIIGFNLQKLFYKQYIIKYQESIEQLHMFESIKSTTDEDEMKFITFYRYIGLIGDIKQEHPKQYNSDLKKFIGQVKRSKKKWLDGIFSSINPVSDQLLISNKETMDWISSFKPLNDLLLKDDILSIAYSSWELNLECKKGIPEFAEELFELENQVFADQYVKAIKMGDIDKLAELDKHSKRSNFGDFSVIENISLPDDHSKIQKIIDYFNNNGKYKNWDSNILNLFCKKLVKIKQFQSTTLSIENSIPKKEIEECLMDSISCLNFKLSLLYLLNLEMVNPISAESKIQANESLLSFFNLYGGNSMINTQDRLDLIESIKLLFKKQKLIGGGGDNESLESIHFLLNNLFQILISAQGTKIEHIIEIYQLFQIQSVPVISSLFNSCFYLNIRSSKFTKYIYSRPSIESYFSQIHTANTVILNVSTNEEEEDEYLFDEYFNLKKYLLPKEFSYEFILGGTVDQFGQYQFNHSVNEILCLLVSKLSLSICKTNRLIDSFFTNTLNSDLLYFLTISRVDLFFKHLEFIQTCLDESNQPGFIRLDNDPFPNQAPTYGSPATELLPSSTIMDGKSIPVLVVPENDKWKLSMSFIAPVYTNSFDYDDIIIDIVVKIMDIDSIQRFIEYNFHVHQFHESIFTKSFYYGRFDIAEFIIQNYSIMVLGFPICKKDQIYNYHREFEFIMENHKDKLIDQQTARTRIAIVDDDTFIKGFLGDFVSRLVDENGMHIKSFNDFTSTTKTIEEKSKILENSIDEMRGLLGTEEYGALDEGTNLELESTLIETIKKPEIQSLIKSTLEKYKLKWQTQREIELVEEQSKYYKYEGNLFIESLLYGDIRFCNMVLREYPGQYKITKRSIDQLIKHKKIHTIKYYYNSDNDCQSLLSNSLKDDEKLNDYLKKKLLVNQDYKFDLNWL